VPYTLAGDGESVTVTLRPKRWNVALQAFAIAWWLLAPLAMLRFLSLVGSLPLWGWFLVAVAPLCLAISVQAIARRTVILVTRLDASSQVEVFGLKLRRRSVPIGARRFAVSPKPKFLSWGESAPWVMLDDSSFRFGHDELSHREAEEVAAALNSFLDSTRQEDVRAAGPA